MVTELQYMPSAANVGAILDKIRSAGTPPKFTHDFLKSTLGFGSSNDRAMVKVLRQLGFLSADGTPTQRYNDYRGEARGKALAAGLREGWAALFLADEKVYERTNSQVQAIAKSLTGAADSTAGKMASTFKALSDKADWTDGGRSVESSADQLAAEGNTALPAPDGGVPGASTNGAGHGGLFQLHHDIHIHLPPTTEVSVYRAIFQAIKAELM